MIRREWGTHPKLEGLIWRRRGSRKRHTGQVHLGLLVVPAQHVSAPKSHVRCEPPGCTSACLPAQDPRGPVLSAIGPRAHIKWHEGSPARLVDQEIPFHSTPKFKNVADYSFQRELKQHLPPYILSWTRPCSSLIERRNRTLFPLNLGWP